MTAEPARPPRPGAAAGTPPRHVHFLGICGYAVSGAALLAQQLGDLVTGSDEHAYPPVSDVVTAAGISWENRHDPRNLDRWGVPDLVVVGNQVRPLNEEWLEARRRGLPVTSEVEFFVSLTEGRLRLSVCGTHGKTTTSALLIHMLDRCGMDPGFRLGSTSLDVGGSARLGTGPFVFEGDEYTTAPWDPRPKFLHMRAAASCVTRLEWDHPDVYPSPEAYREPFVRLAESMPGDGLLVLCGDDPEALGLRAHAACPVIVYGEGEDADWRVSRLGDDGTVQRFRIASREQGFPEVALTFPGRHNALNATAALALAVFAGAPISACVDACADFRGPARRFEILGAAGGVTVVDDYAHHPTEVWAAVNAARARYGAARIIAVHTPHTYSRTRTLLEDYRHSFEEADVVVLGPVEAARERHQPATVSSADVADRVTGREVHLVEGSDQGVELVLGLARPGDVVLVLSLEGFDKIARRIHAGLAKGRPEVSRG
ncbi:MAG: UDP-N-acetylmuramate--L-alanine ligase [Candidatus Dormibacteria bacterium]